MAGSIHDIGKISIPAEILTKPTKLTDIEFSLIQEHPRTGYEMLKRCGISMAAGGNCLPASRTDGRIRLSQKSERG